jgi:RimJ/RimL family protein N-acetyltransferase
MTPLRQTEELKHTLEVLPPVESVGKIKVEDGMIHSLVVGTRTIGEVTVRRLVADDAPKLFALYVDGLSEETRRLFAPYPLFHTPPVSADELATRIIDWKKENDWTALNMVKDNRIIGFAILKRFRTEQVTSGIMIADEYQGKSLGFLLQSVIVAQARLLKLRRFHIKVISDNQASVRLHEKCGFRWTRRLAPPLYEEVLQYLNERDKKNGTHAPDRHVMEMAIELEHPTE